MTYRFYVLIIMALLIGGCATVMPSTEGLVFGEKRNQNLAGYTDQSAFLRKLSVGLTASYARIIPPASFRRAAVRQKGGPHADTLDSFFFSSLPVVPSASLSYKNRIAVGSNLVPLPGFWQLDGTVRFYRQYYLTLSKKVGQPNFQVIFERRLLYKDHGGITAGVFYRHDPFNFESTIFEPDFNISWFGLRSLLQTPNNQGSGIHLQGNVSLGYIPEFKTPLFEIGISVGFRAPITDGPHTRAPGPIY